MRERRLNAEAPPSVAMYAGGIVVAAILLLALARGGFRGHLG